MTSRKFAVSFPAELYALTQQVAEAAGLSLSAWLARAIDRDGGSPAGPYVESSTAALQPLVSRRCSPAPT
jgi:hypothetical protein